MAAVSGIACTAGASIICVDLIIRQFPGKKDFKIEDSNPFLSAGLSLSFGVMIFSSLYSMLPSARKYFEKGGMEPRPATVLLIGCFLGGALVISILSRILHQYIPHAVVDCDHDHGDEEEGKSNVHQHEHSHSNPMEEVRSHGPHPDGAVEPAEGHPSYGSTGPDQGILRRPSLHHQISTKVSNLVSGSKEFCDENGQCFGYSDPCGQECFRNVQKSRLQSFLSRLQSRPNGFRAQTMPAERRPLLEEVDDTAVLTSTISNPPTMENSAQSLPPRNGNSSRPSIRHKHSSHSISSSSSSSGSHTHAHHANQHHHHVPTNVFMSIGLQTSIAIALHKIPEGFITYATNHANPTLGLSIFLALFIHNITEGFAMALPLYLAINSRWKAMFWSALLGGVSQPLGAGVAALWFKVARRGGEGTGGEPGDTVYGGMFAVTAGIMAMVSLQLLGESLDLTHSRKLCFASAFAGMGILGLSSALTA